MRLTNFLLSAAVCQISTQSVTAQCYPNTLVIPGEYRVQSMRCEGRGPRWLSLLIGEFFWLSRRSVLLHRKDVTAWVPFPLRGIRLARPGMTGVDYSEGGLFRLSLTEVFDRKNWGQSGISSFRSKHRYARVRVTKALFPVIESPRNGERLSVPMLPIPSS